MVPSVTALRAPLRPRGKGPDSMRQLAPVDAAALPQFFLFACMRGNWEHRIARPARADFHPPRERGGDTSPLQRFFGVIT